MTLVKAALTITLKANDVVVAEMEDASLWQQVLSAIHSGVPSLTGGHAAEYAHGGERGQIPTHSKGQMGAERGAEPIDLFSQQLGIEKARLEGACSPTTAQPYMHLDAHCWEEMKRQNPQRGKTTVAPIALAATLLALWSKKADIGIVTQAQARAVLATISVEDKNPSRSISNASWLQQRPGQVVLNPAEISKAVKLAKCFCTKDWTTWTQTTST
jgi:hypothetical protein